MVSPASCGYRMRVLASSQRPGSVAAGSLFGRDFVDVVLRWKLLVWLLLVLTSAGACKKREKTQPPGPKIKKVKITGAEAVDASTIEEHIDLRASSVIGEKSHYVPGLEVSDRERIKALYEAYGHYDAVVEPIEVEIVNPKRKLKKQKAKVSIVLHEGAGTVVASRQWSWPTSPSDPLDRHAVVTAAGLAGGDVFTLPALHQGAYRAVEALKGQGYPFASVTESAEVDRVARTARVFFVVEPGQRFTISRIDVVGLQRVREDLVRRELVGVRGRLYSPKLVAQIESAVYGTLAFSTVSVTLGEETDDGQLALVVRVSERKMQELALGVVLGADPVQWSQGAGFRYRHGNLFRNLTRFEVKAGAGWAELPNPFVPQAQGPLGVLGLRMSKRGLLERKLVWTAEPGANVEIRQGLQLWRLQNRLGVSRFIGRTASLGLSYNNRYVNFFNLTPGLRGELDRLGIELKDPYVSSFLELQAAVFHLDSLAAPRRGVKFKTTYAFAHRYLGGHFDYHLVQPELRGYFDPHPRLQLAARARVGFIFPYATTTSAPLDLRFYLGGLSDVRGWPLRQLSPRFEICDVGGVAGCQSIPIGGNTEVLGNLELRVQVAGPVWLAFFGDVGDVRARTATIVPGDWLYTTGAGVRYATPIGPLRLDVGVRLNDSVRFPTESRVGVHFSLGEAF